MARTTPELLAGIIEVDGDIVLDPFIETATMLVDRLVAPAEDGNGDPYYTAPQLEMIERWLSAHFYAVLDPRVVTEGVSSLMSRYESHVDLHLDNTRYGQQAMMLDTAGGLARWNRDVKIGGKRKAALYWGGTEGGL